VNGIALIIGGLVGMIGALVFYPARNAFEKFAITFCFYGGLLSITIGAVILLSASTVQ
jgi:hypothetical protein